MKKVAVTVAADECCPMVHLYLSFVSLTSTMHVIWMRYFRVLRSDRTWQLLTKGYRKMRRPLLPRQLASRRYRRPYTLHSRQHTTSMRSMKVSSKLLHCKPSFRRVQPVDRECLEKCFLMQGVGVPMRLGAKCATHYDKALMKSTRHGRIGKTRQMRCGRTGLRMLKVVHAAPN